jgi:2',3'-cyclic-nucleotide 2'-phosphodiesterase (5'-nucleotidase family)
VDEAIINAGREPVYEEVLVGRKEIEALVQVLRDQLEHWKDNVVVGTWTISFDRDRHAFLFEKCELGAYCEERPSVIALDGAVVDRGGPLLEG